jgi:hypothetical protein
LFSATGGAMMQSAPLLVEKFLCMALGSVNPFAINDSFKPSFIFLVSFSIIEI